MNNFINNLKENFNSFNISGVSNQYNCDIENMLYSEKSASLISNILGNGYDNEINFSDKSSGTLDQFQSYNTALVDLGNFFEQKIPSKPSVETISETPSDNGFEAYTSLTQLNTNIANLDKKILDSKKKIDDNNKAIDGLNVKIKQLESEKAKISENIRSLENQKNAEEKNGKAQRTQIDNTIVEEKKKSAQVIQSLNAQLAKEKVSANVTKIKAQITAENERIKNLEASLQSKKASAKKVTDTNVSKLDAKLNSEKANLSAKDKLLLPLKSEIAKKQAVLTAEQKNLKSLEAEKTKLTDLKPSSQNLDQVTKAFSNSALSTSKIIDSMMKPLPGKNVDPAAVAKLKENVKNIPPEVLELIKKDGASISILKKTDSFVDTDEIQKIDPKEAQKQKDTIKNELAAKASISGLSNLKFGNLEETDRTNLKGQICSELEKIYSVSPSDKEDFKNWVDNINENPDSISGYIEYLKSKRSKETNKNNIAVYNKMIAMEEMLKRTYDAPLNYKGKYVKYDDYYTCKGWDEGINGGIILGLTYRDNNKIFLKEETLEPNYKIGVGKIATHELAHALENAATRLSPNFTKDHIDKVNANYQANLNNDKNPSVIDTTKTHEFISRYSSTSYKEYLAETLCAFFDPVNSEKLKKYDPDQYNTIKTLLSDINKAKKLAA